MKKTNPMLLIDFYKAVHSDMLPDKIEIPGDIPKLVQDAYEGGGESCKEKVRTSN